MPEHRLLLKDVGTPDLQRIDVYESVGGYSALRDALGRLTPGELARAGGWELKPEGLCRDALCVPMPPAASWVRDRGADLRVDLAGLSRHRGQPVPPSPEPAVSSTRKAQNWCWSTMVISCGYCARRL